MGIKNALIRTGKRAADTVSKLSVLSSDQVEKLEATRERYLTEMPDPNDGTAQYLTNRLLAASGIEIYSEYLRHLSDLYVPIAKDSEFLKPFNVSYNIRYFNITKWVTHKEENSIEKLVNVYEVLSNEDCNIALVFHRAMTGTDVYLAVTNNMNSGSNVDVENYRKRLAEAIRGNFPGAEWTDKHGRGIIPCLKNDLPYSVASASNIPGEKSEKFTSQTIEKLLDGIVPDSVEKEYTIILLATPIRNIENRKLRLARYYTALAPYAGWQTNYTYTESDAATSMATFGLNAGVSAGVQSGANRTMSNARGETDSSSNTQTDSTNDSSSLSHAQTEADATSQTNSHTVSDATSNSNTYAQSSSNAHTESINTNVTENHGSQDSLGVGAEFGNFKVDYQHSVNQSIAHSSGSGMADTFTNASSEAVSHASSHSTADAIANAASHSVSNAITQAASHSIGKAVANTLGKAVTNTVTTGQGVFKAVNMGGNFGANFARSSNVSATVGKNEGIQQSFTNYTVKHTLEILETQMKRYEQSTALGMWDFAAYVLSEDQNVASNVAHTYLALTQGEDSYLSQTAVNLWRGDMGENSRHAQEICAYLRELRHPLFGLDEKYALITHDHTLYTYPSIVNAATSLSGKELAYSLNFPKKSVEGFPVVECAEFGRNVMTYGNAKMDEPIDIGTVFHMNHMESNHVQLDKNSLCSHTFVTGSTGSGKSNTVYKILSEAVNQGAKFLVIEPAKGEYKSVFGMQSDVHVFGTNPYLSPMLRLNPFSFPKGIHIFEHLDRLVEIFNVCWPMYAAMPAILKRAVEKSYADCGWDMMRSVNKYGEDLYPTFADVARNVKIIIESSEYDTENKGAYKGSLLTRLQSLTNGINGTIFTTDEIALETIFDENTIVDLSRVGSSETKALIMGMLVLKLQEYRMAMATELNSSLKHITVLEEAHNLLRRTSFEQSSEAANLLGKSVEMISNAIAEMRTYGEGFVIVDQSPGLLDMSAIRNTNTKIIMRLPDQGDRELVGRAANLNDDQIAEIAKLPCGVAAIYQNEWIQPVLCKVDQYEGDNEMYRYIPQGDVFCTDVTNATSESLLECIMNKELFRDGDRADMRRLKKMVVASGLSTSVKVDFLEYLDTSEADAIKPLRKLLYNFLSAEDAFENARKCDDFRTWVNTVVDGLKPSVREYSNRQIDVALGLLLYEKSLKDSSYNDIFCRYTEVYKAEGGVL